MSVRRWFTAAAAAVVLSMGGTMVGVAQAAPPPTINRDTWLMSTPGDSYGPPVRMKFVPNGATVTLSCWSPGNTAYGQNKWFEIRVNGYTGFVPAPAVSYQTTVRYCGY